MDWWLVFAFFLYVVCAFLLVAEFFIPSGGLIGILSLVSLISGVMIFFRHSTTTGWIGVGIAAVMIPAVVVFMCKMYPKTKIGKATLLSPPERKYGDGVPDAFELKSLIGKTGVVFTTLRPVGMCDFGGKRIECVAEGSYVEKDKKVQVIGIDGTQVTVRVIE